MYKSNHDPRHVFHNLQISEVGVRLGTLLAMMSEFSHDQCRWHQWSTRRSCTLAQKSLEVCKQHRPCMSCIGTSILMRQKGIWMEMLVETSKSRDLYQSGNWRFACSKEFFFGICGFRPPPSSAAARLTALHSRPVAPSLIRSQGGGTYLTQGPSTNQSCMDTAYVKHARQRIRFT